MHIKTILKNITFILLSILLIQSIPVYANEYLPNYPGNVELRKYDGKLYVDGDEMPTDDYCYYVGQSNAYILTNVLNGESAAYVAIQFEDGCKYKIWKNDSEYKYEDSIEGLENLVILSEIGKYTVLLSDNNANFFDKYARYECEVRNVFSDELNGSIFNKFKHNDIKVTFDKNSQQYIYGFDNEYLIKTNHPFGTSFIDSLKYEINNEFVIISDIFRNNQIYSISGYNTIEEDGMYTMVLDVNIYGNNFKYCFDFTIGENLFTNLDFYRIPIGMHFISAKLDSKNINIDKFTDTVLNLSQDGIYDMRFSSIDKNIYINQRIYKNSDKKLIKIEGNINSKSTNKKVKVIKLKEDLDIEVIHNGSNYSKDDVISENGSYYISAKDKFGNIQSYYFSILGQINVGYVIIFIFIIAIAVFNAKRSSEN